MSKDQRGYLDRAAILAVPDQAYEDVPVPEWGGTIRVRGLTAGELDTFQDSNLEGAGKKQKVTLRDIRARLVVLTVVDGEGQRMFGNADIHALSQKSAVAMDRVYAVAARLSGLTDENIEELAKNSGSAPNGASASVSP